MNKFFSVTVCMLLCVCILVSCVPVNGGNDADMPVVYTSFYPLYDFTVKIADGHADVRMLVPAGIDPHDWEPNTSDISALEHADMFIYNGASLEFWAESILGALENDKLAVVETTQDSQNPHVWLDPMKAKGQAGIICNALSELAPGNKDIYEAALTRWSGEFDKLDAEYRAGLSNLRKRDIIVAHEAFSCLCDAYGLNQHAITGISPETEPTPARMAEIIKLAKEYDISTIFFEELISPKIAETIARETGAKTAVLSPLEGLTDEQRENGGDYFSVMRQNLEALIEALQ